MRNMVNSWVRNVKAMAMVGQLLNKCFGLNSDELENAARGYIIYPTPSGKNLFIKNLNQGVNVKIYGRIVSDQDYRGSIDISAFEKGIYFVTFDINSFTRSIKLIKK